jgi:DNA processing protein
VAAVEVGGNAAPAPWPVRPPRSELEALVRDLARRGVSVGRGSLSAREPRAEGWARRALEILDRFGVHVLVPGMAAYPEPFLELKDRPRAVFAAGRLELLRSPMVAVVGTRSCTERGRAAAERIAGGLAAAGVTVVSGLALGIDGAAHRAAGAGRTIGVLGCGLDVPYPPRHQPLQRQIARQGLLLSEQIPGAPPLGFHFPRRNRMIAALGRGVVVVEAPLRSGALVTAEHGLDLGRHIFAVPGPRGAASSAGSNDLLDDGATLVTSAREILEVLGLPVPAATGDDAARPAGLSGVGLALWQALEGQPRHADELAAELGVEPRHGLASLLALEVQGLARQLPGMRFARR